jgi:ribosome-binding ATPase
MLQVGIVGLPNIGKSTLFNAVTRTRKAEAANYPFCTIEPNIGIVQVPDHRLEPLRALVKTNVVIPAAIELVDIAGLVEGASKGQGLGNQFLANIREVDALIHVVRCFENEDIIHNKGSIEPIRDIEIVITELILADLESVEKQLQNSRKKARSNDKEAIQKQALLERLLPHLNQTKPANTLDYTDKENSLLKSFSLLTSKPIIYACNVDEETISNNPQVIKVKQYVKNHHNAGCCVICSKLEEELGSLSKKEAVEFLGTLGVTDSGVTKLIRETYDLLGLASYFTAGEKEVRAWTFKKGMKAPQCAGVIHGDFEKGFIKAEVVSYDDLIAAGSINAAKEAGKYRLEGKTYEFKDSDVAYFRFSN